MRVRILLGNEKIEHWITKRVQGQLEIVQEGPEIILLSRYSDDAQTVLDQALQDGIQVLFVAGAEDEEGLAWIEQVNQKGLQDVLSWEPSEPLNAAEILSFLLDCVDPAPIFEEQKAQQRIVVVSSRQSGGTFVAWNLWAALKAKGEKVSLLTASPASPLSVWVTPPYDGITFGATQGDEDDNFWVVDGSDTHGEIDGEFDVAILVTDSDPAKPEPVLPKAERTIRLLNRVPSQIPTERLAPEVDGFIEDLGHLVFDSMYDGVAVSEQLEPLGTYLVDLVESNVDQKYRVSLGVAQGEQPPEVSSSAGPETENAGFVDDTSLLDSSKAGFVMDEDSPGPRAGFDFNE